MAILDVTMLALTYDVLSKVPGGRRIFSKMIGRMAPYTGTIGAHVEELAPGYGRVTLRDRKAVRNHLDCVHAMALANMLEVTTGVAFLYGFPPKTRGILAGFEVDYLKKGRGTLTGICHCPVPDSNARKEYTVEADIFDKAGGIVARGRAKWLVGPQK